MKYLANETLKTDHDRYTLLLVDKKVVGKSKAEQMTERQQELERRLQDVTGQLGSGKKSAKKGKFLKMSISLLAYSILPIQMIQTKQMHKLLIANRHLAALVIHHHRVRQIAVRVTAPTAKQVRRIMSIKRKV